MSYCCHGGVFQPYLPFLPGLQVWTYLRLVSPQLVDPLFVLLFVAYHVAVHGVIQYVNFQYSLSFYPAAILTTDQVMV